MSGLKMFDPKIDGGFQDECDCDSETSLACELRNKPQNVVSFCICLCHQEMHEARIDSTNPYDVGKLVEMMTADGFHAVITKMKKQVIEKALEQAGNNGVHAAALLGMNRTTLVMIRRSLGFPMGKRGAGSIPHE